MYFKENSLRRIPEDNAFVSQRYFASISEKCDKITEEKFSVSNTNNSTKKKSMISKVNQTPNSLIQSYVEASSETILVRDQLSIDNTVRIFFI